MQQAAEGPQSATARKFMHACEMSLSLSHARAPYHKDKRLTHSTLSAYVAGSLAFSSVILSEQHSSPTPNHSIGHRC